MQNLSNLKSHSWLSWFFRGLLVVVFLLLATRLIELQVIKGSYYRGLSENNRIRRIPIIAKRGEILARGGEIIVGNTETKKNPLSEEIITEWTRNYLLGPEAAHITGYLGEVNTSELKKIDPSCPEKGERFLGSFIGRSGLEEYYDCLLRGTNGEELIEVDTFGNKLRTFARKPSLAGESLRTTININLQKKVSEVMKDKKGALIITDAKGEILALFSSPSFDPNLFVSKANQEKITSLITSEELPFFNRVIAGAYHPGSIFKIVTSTAALEDGKIDKNFKYEDAGVIKVNEFTYYNWYFTQYGGVEGSIGLEKAIARSTDTFFYKIGELTGADRLVYWSRVFGLGEKTGIDIPGEVTGLVPSPEWKKAVKGERWFLGNTYHMSIGQGDLTATPLGMNLVTSVIANNGLLCKPHLKKTEKADCKDLKLQKSTIEQIRNGMAGACSPGGTAFPFFDFPVKVACKTGTAETTEKGDPHAWFSIFAPADNPEIVVTVLIEKGGEGSKVAAPIAREILDYWLLSKNP